MSKNYPQQPKSRPSSNATPGQYTGSPVSTMQNVAQAPPPLVRAASQSNQPDLGMGATNTASSAILQKPVAAYSLPEMLAFSPEQMQALLEYQRLHPTWQCEPDETLPPFEYPPPLIPVNGSSKSTSTGDDTPQPVPIRREDSQKRDSRGRRALIPIPETIADYRAQPYGIRITQVDEKFVLCINFEAYIYTELLMTLPDFVSQFFPTCDINKCREVLTDGLGVYLYQGHRFQMEKLMEAGKCSSMNEELPLIRVRNIREHMPIMKYMFRNMGLAAPVHSSEEHPAKKRRRTI